MIAKEQNGNHCRDRLSRQDALILVVLGGLSVGLLLPLAIQSTNYAYGTTDDYNHYLFAISSYEDLEFLFNGWGKPLFTFTLLIYLLVPGQALESVRFLNCSMHVLSVLLTYLLARRLALRQEASFLSAVLVLLAPQNLELAQSILTEPLFTVMVLLTFLAYADTRYRIAFVLAGFSLLARSEGLFVIVVLLIAHYWRFGVRITINQGGLAIFPPGIIALTTTLLFRQPFLAFVPPNYSTFQTYGHGEPLEYVLGTSEALGLPSMLLALLGIALWVRQGSRISPVIAPFLVFGVLVVVFHDLIWALGLFGSWGTLRHLAPTAPVFAYFAGYAFQQGWELLQAQEREYRYQRPLRAISLGIAVMLAGLWTNWYADPVITPTVEVQVSKEAVDWLKANRPEAVENSQNLFVYNPIILSFLDLTYPEVPNQGGALIDRKIVDNEIQPGGVVLWDSHHGPLEGKTPLDYFEGGFMQLFMLSKEWYVDSEGNIVEFSVYIFLKLSL
ncbi:MAG: phospholipid carrier-dependent glycosyltransferase [Candidatus Heimdallarchaeota archaeon]